MNYGRRTLVYILMSFLPAVFCAAAGRPSADEILRKVDSLYRGTTSFAEVEMVVETPEWKRVLDLKAWSEGMDKTFIVILAPKKDAGVATLRVKKEMWNFFPRINKTLKIPPSMMMGSWMGSDFTNDDLVKESSLIDDYNARFTDGEDPPGTWTLELTPKTGTASVWGKIRVTVKSENLLPLEENYYDERGEKIRVMKFRGIQTIGNRTIPMEMELIPLKKPGNRTLLKYKTIQFDAPLNPSVFTLQNLRRQR